MVKRLVTIVLVAAGLTLSVAYLRGRVREKLAVLNGFENAAQLRQTLTDDDYYSYRFTQGGTNYVGVSVIARMSKDPVLRHTRFFHQAAPFYIFDSEGRKVDFSRNCNDDGAFHLRWPGKAATGIWQCGWAK